MQPFQLLKLSPSSKARFYERLETMDEVTGFEEDPAFASLAAVLGLQFELGKEAYDRLSPFFGVEIGNSLTNPWHIELIAKQDKIGICLKRADGKPLELRHSDFVHLIDADSFDSNANLTQIVLYPVDIARRFERRGFNLVVVKSWIQSQEKVSYLFANPLEIESNIAHLHAKMLLQNQLALLGTHDIVDHLLNSNAMRFNLRKPLFEETLTTLNEVFFEGHTPTPSELLLSYLIGILLDDMAQPRWYASIEHEILTRMALQSLKQVSTRSGVCDNLTLPNSFHRLIETVRSGRPNPLSLTNTFSLFVQEI